MAKRKSRKRRTKAAAGELQGNDDHDEAHARILEGGRPGAIHHICVEIEKVDAGRHPEEEHPRVQPKGQARGMGMGGEISKFGPEAFPHPDGERRQGEGGQGVPVRKEQVGEAPDLIGLGGPQGDAPDDRL